MHNITHTDIAHIKYAWDYLFVFFLTFNLYSCCTSACSLQKNHHSIHECAYNFITTLNDSNNYTMCLLVNKSEWLRHLLFIVYVVILIGTVNAFWTVCVRVCVWLCTTLYATSRDDGGPQSGVLLFWGSWAEKFGNPWSRDAMNVTEIMKNIKCFGLN